MFTFALANIVPLVNIEGRLQQHFYAIWKDGSYFKAFGFFSFSFLKHWFLLQTDKIFGFALRASKAPERRRSTSQ